MKLIYQARAIEVIDQYPRTKGNLVLFDNDDQVMFVMEALSGGWGKGTIPLGVYNLGIPAKLSDEKKNNPYKKQGYPWWIGLQAIHKTDRSGFGIHPDGNVPGTMGCVSPVHDDIWFFEYSKPLIENGELKQLEVL